MQDNDKPDDDDLCTFPFGVAEPDKPEPKPESSWDQFYWIVCVCFIGAWVIYWFLDWWHGPCVTISC